MYIQFSTMQVWSNIPCRRMTKDNFCKKWNWVGIDRESVSTRWSIDCVLALPLQLLTTVNLPTELYCFVTSPAYHSPFSRIIQNKFSWSSIAMSHPLPWLTFSRIISNKSYLGALLLCHVSPSSSISLTWFQTGYIRSKLLFDRISSSSFPLSPASFQIGQLKFEGIYPEESLNSTLLK